MPREQRILADWWVLKAKWEQEFWPSTGYSVLLGWAGGHKDSKEWGSGEMLWQWEPCGMWEECPSAGRDGTRRAAERVVELKWGEMKGGETENKYARLRVSKG